MLVVDGGFLEGRISAMGPICVVSLSTVLVSFFLSSSMSTSSCHRSSMKIDVNSLVRWL